MEHFLNFIETRNPFLLELKTIHEPWMFFMCEAIMFFF